MLTIAISRKSSELLLVPYALVTIDMVLLSVFIGTGKTKYILLSMLIVGSFVSPPGLLLCKTVFWHPTFHDVIFLAQVLLLILCARLFLQNVYSHECKIGMSLIVTVFSVDRKIFFSETEEGDLLPGTWAELSNVTKGLWISLCYHSSFNNDPCVSQKELADITGCSVAQVKKSVSQLKEHGLVTSSKIVMSRQGRESYRYSLKQSHDDVVQFDQNVIRGGAWNLLCPTAQALYPIVKVCAQPISENSIKTVDGFESASLYTVCYGEPGVLCALSGFGVRSYQKACVQLIKVGLLKRAFDPISVLGVLRSPRMFLDDHEQKKILQSRNVRKELLQKIF